MVTKAISKSQLKPEFQALVQFMQRLNFGKIKNMEIRDGVPILDPAPKIIKTVKLGGENRKRPEASLEDFALKSEVRDLIHQVSKMRNGVVLSVEVRYGLPCLIKVQEPVS